MVVDTMEQNSKRTCQHCPHSARDFPKYIHLHTSSSSSTLSSPSNSESDERENGNLDLSGKHQTTPTKSKTQNLAKINDSFCICKESSSGDSSSQSTCNCKKHNPNNKEPNLANLLPLFLEPAYPIEEILEVVDEILVDFKTEHEAVCLAGDMSCDQVQLERQEVHLRGGIGDEVGEKLRDLRVTVEDAEDGETADGEKKSGGKDKKNCGEEKMSGGDEEQEVKLEEPWVRSQNTEKEYEENAGAKQEPKVDGSQENPEFSPSDQVDHYHHILWVPHDACWVPLEALPEHIQTALREGGSTDDLESSSADQIDHHHIFWVPLEDLPEQIQTALRGVGLPDTAGYEADDEEEVYEDEESKQLLQARVLAHIKNPELPIDIPSDEFYQIMRYSKFPGFLAPIQSVSEQELEPKKALDEVKICSVCGGYKMVLEGDWKTTS